MNRIFLLGLLAGCDDGEPKPSGDDTAEVVPDGDDTGEPCESVVWFYDGDGDGYGAGSGTISCESPGASYVDNNGDCNDALAEFSPDATEMCDEIDNDCDGEIDEDGAADAPTWYEDNDGDGYGENSVTARRVACEQPSGYADNHDDCNDSDADTRPGGEEVCDGLDNDCDDEVDEDVGTSFYVDSDRDGYGDPEREVIACSARTGVVADNTDCDDTSRLVNPGASERCNGDDDDCDGRVDESATDMGFYCIDLDGDGYGTTDDTVRACSLPSGYAEICSDCDDAVATTYPGAPELCSDEVDNDCDDELDEGDEVGTYYRDSDGDGYGDPDTETEACSVSSAWISDGTDCDDGDLSVHPDAVEVCLDGVDNDCDGRADESDDGLGARDICPDIDGDGFGDSETEPFTSCVLYSGYAASCSDCDDGDDLIYAGATEVCDGYDNDCDGTVDEYCSDYENWEGWATYAFDESYARAGEPGCIAWWWTTGEPTTGCADCEFAFDVEFAYDADLAEDDGTCGDVGLDGDLSLGLGFGNYYGIDLLFYNYRGREWYPSFYADMDYGTDVLTFWVGYMDEGRPGDYYASYWYGYAQLSE